MRRVTLLSGGHMANDMYGNLPTALAPYFVLSGRLSAPAAGALVLVYLSGSSVLQPIFGHLADRSGRRWFAVSGPAWIGSAMSLLAIARVDWALYGLVGLGGIGTAAFHPQAASMVDRVAGNAKGWAMAVFSMGGNLGYAIGPLLAAIIITVGRPWSLLAVVPGLAVSAFLFRFAPMAGSRPATLRQVGSRRSPLQTTIELALIVAVITIRSGTMLAMIFLLPLYFHEHHAAASLGSFASTLLLLLGAVGGLCGGRISDRVGRKPVVVCSLFIAAPLLLLLSFAPLPLVWPIVAAGGAALLASNSITVVQAQALLPGRTGMASGLTLGLGFGLSGLITFLVSTLTRQIGVYDTLLIAALFPLAAAILALCVREAQPDVVGERAPA